MAALRPAHTACRPAWLFFASASFISTVTAASSAWPASNHTISWWYAADNNWPAVISLIQPHVAVVTSIQTYCGYTVSDGGSIVGALSPACAAFFSALTPLGVRPELTLDSGNCSIDAYRSLWGDRVISIAALLDAALAANASGINIDLEPQGDDCSGGATGTAADATLFATWLAALRDAFHARGMRVTVDVADWSPVLSQYSTLAPAVDRLQDMETYNAGSLAQWMGYYSHIVNDAVPRSAVGVGLGVWLDSSLNGTWPVTPQSATQRVAQAMADGVPELAMFRLDPETTPTWPLDFWWDALLPFVQQ